MLVRSKVIPGTLTTEKHYLYEILLIFLYKCLLPLLVLSGDFHTLRYVCVEGVGYRQREVEVFVLSMN